MFIKRCIHLSITYTISCEEMQLLNKKVQFYSIIYLLLICKSRLENPQKLTQVLRLIRNSQYCIGYLYAFLIGHILPIKIAKLTKESFSFSNNSPITS